MRSKQSTWLGPALVWIAAWFGCGGGTPADGQAVSSEAGAADSGTAAPAGSGAAPAGAGGAATPAAAGASVVAGTAADGGGAGGVNGAVGTSAAGAGAEAEKGSPRFSAIYRDIFVAKGCTGSAQCHQGPAGGLSLGSQRGAYDRLVDKPAMGMNLTLMPPHCADSGLKRVVPGDPENSLLVHKITGKQTCGIVMPPNPPLLEAAEVDQIKAWIMKGAPDD
ncbi:MAG: hypothetical protein ABW321_25230 [Polyangiales bacterium]